MEVIERNLIIQQEVEHVSLFPLGDIQFNGDYAGIAAERLRNHVQRFGRTRSAYALGMGDYVDIASPSGRAKFRAANFYDNVEDFVEESVRSAVEEIGKLLLPTQGRWLGMLHGHHYYPFKDGQTSDTMLAELLDAPYLGTSMALILNVITPTWTRTIRIWAHHGEGSGGPATPINRLMKHLTTWDADVYLMGHTPHLSAAKVPRLSIAGNNELADRETLLVGTGGWALSYTPGRRRGGLPVGDYAEQKFLTPVSLGAPIIKVGPDYLRVEF